MPEKKTIDKTKNKETETHKAEETIYNKAVQKESKRRNKQEQAIKEERKS